MTKLKINVPPVADLEKIISESGLKGLVNRFSCYDFLIGSQESINFLRDKYNEYKNEKLNSNETV